MGYVGGPDMGKLITRVGFDGEESRRDLDEEDRDDIFFGGGSSVNRHMTTTMIGFQSLIDGFQPPNPV